MLMSFFRVEPFFCLNFKVKKMLQVEIHMSNFTKMSALEKRTKICSTTFQTNGAKIHLKVQCFPLKMLLVCILSPCQNATNLSLSLLAAFERGNSFVFHAHLHMHTCKYNQWYDEKKRLQVRQIMMAKQRTEHFFWRWWKKKCTQM